MKNTTNADFTRMPHTWSCRKDVPLAKRVIVAYIFTRANITEMEWELVAADIVNIWGLSKGTVSKTMKDLEKQCVIQLTELRKKSGDFPSKIYRINRVELEKLMTPPITAVHTVNCHGSSREPPRFNRTTATVPPMNLEEERKEELKKKTLKEEKIPVQETEGSSFNEVAVTEPKLPECAVRFLEKTPKEQVALLEAEEANKTRAKDLKAGKEVLMTQEFAEHFANM